MHPAIARAMAYTGLWLLLVLPLFLALLQVRGPDFESTGTVLNLLGRLAGIAGFTCLLVAAVLIIRVPGFDRLFGGLTTLWKIHHRLGGAALLLLLAHPLLLSFAAADVSLSAAVDVLFPPGGSVAAWFGWSALVFLMIFLAPSFAFFGQPDYQRWKLVHRLSAPAAVLGLLHTLLAGQTLPPPSSWLVWFGLAGLAAAAFAYRFLFSRHLGRRSYRVAHIARPANDVVELSLEAEGRRLHYLAGQFIYLTPYDRSLPAGFAEEHPYTLSSSPTEKQLRVAIKDRGTSSRALQHITPGSRVQVEGPYGDFFRRHFGRELWIAGGIGIAPFLSRARHLAATGEPADIVLLFMVQDQARALFHDELEALASARENFVLVLHYFYIEGPLTIEFLERHCPDFAARDAYICGPLPLISLAQRLLLAGGSQVERISTEEFALL
jgi:predicted ferric reductase